MAVAGEARPAAARPAVAAWSAVGPRDAPAIAFVHGTRLTRAMWAPQLHRLAGGYRCVALDLPGHGAAADDAFTLEAAARGVADAIEAEVPAGRAVVVGLSLGGYVAMEAAVRHPERVAGLVLAGCSAEPVGPTALAIRSLAGVLEHAPRGALDAANAAFFRLRYPRSIAGPIIAGGFWTRGGAAALHALVGVHFLDRLGELWTPVLVLNGTLDPVFAPGGDTWAAACRRGRSELLGRATHLSSLDRPGPFAAAVARFVDEVATGG